MDVLASGPERSPRTRRERSRQPRRLPAPQFWRVAAAVLGVLLGVGGVAALRSGTGPVELAPAPAATAPAGDFLAALPPPPYDGLPGRTAIPEPTQTGRGDVLRGPLPVVGPPGQPAARTAAELVLGRYCRRPGRYAVAIDKVDGWRRVRALAVRLDRSTDSPWIVLELAWTGKSYRWAGRTVQLDTC